MAFSSAQLQLHTTRLVADGMNEWTYDDTETAAAVSSAYIVAPKAAVGDLVWYRQFASLATKSSITAITLHYVTAVAALTGLLTLSDPIAPTPSD